MSNSPIIGYIVETRPPPDSVAEAAEKYRSLFN